jgi:hypothetical protein
LTHLGRGGACVAALVRATLRATLILMAAELILFGQPQDEGLGAHQDDVQNLSLN